MTYYVISSPNNQEQITVSPYEVDDYVEFQGYTIDYKVNSCRGCSELKDSVEERFDFYGITTGHYCQDCYENNYPYRKDRYATIEYDGYGERLSDEY